MGIFSNFFNKEPKAQRLSFDCDAPPEHSGFGDSAGHQRRLVVSQIQAGRDAWVLEFKVREPTRQNNYDQAWRNGGNLYGTTGKCYTSLQAIDVIDSYYKSLPNPDMYGAGILKRQLLAYTQPAPTPVFQPLNSMNPA